MCSGWLISALGSEDSCTEFNAPWSRMSTERAALRTMRRWRGTPTARSTSMSGRSHPPAKKRIGSRWIPAADSSSSSVYMRRRKPSSTKRGGCRASKGLAEQANGCLSSNSAGNGGIFLTSTAIGPSGVVGATWAPDSIEVPISLGMTPTPQLASVQAVSPSAHDSAAAWRLPRLNGTTAADHAQGAWLQLSGARRSPPA